MCVRFPRLLFVSLLGLWLAAWATPARAQVPEKRQLSEPPPQFVFGGECPDPKAVQQAVLDLIPVERHAPLAHGVRVELEDLAESYRVTVWKDGASVKKSYSDPARDCEGRARFAAVFTVLTLMPPELGAEPLEKPEPAPARPPAPAPVPVSTPVAEPPNAPTRHPLTQLELSGLYASAPAILEAPSMHAFGGELRVALGRSALAGTLSVAYITPASFDSNGVQGELWRLPLSVGARLRSDLGDWSLAADLGLLVAVQRVHATNLLIERTQSSADLGLRAGAQLSRPIGPHLAPFVAAFVWLSPAPSEISALPQGVLGNLPYLWLGGAAGVSFGL